MSETGLLVPSAGLASQAWRCMQHTHSCMEFVAWLHLLSCLFSQIALGCAIIFFENRIQLTSFHLTGLMLSEAKAVLLTALVPSQ